MAGWPVKKNDSSGVSIVFPIYDADGDLVSGAASLDSEVSKDKGTFTDASGEATEIATSSGVYYLDLVQAEINADVVAVITKTGTAGAKTAVNVIYTSTRQIDDLAYPATSGRSLQVETDGMVHADLKEWLGSAPNALQSGRVDSYVGAMAGDVITAAAIADAAIDAASFAADAITSSVLATSAVNEIRDAILSDSTPFAGGNIDAAISSRSSHDDPDPSGYIDVAISSRSSHSAADAAGAVWDEDATGHQTQGTFGQAIGDPAADTDTIFGMLTDLEDGNTTVEANIASMDANVITASVIAGDAITAAKIATDAITSDELAASALQEIADTVFQRDMSAVEASAPVHSLATAVLAAVSRVRDNSGTQEIYRTNGTTVHASRAITTSGALDPISELGVAS